jgi:predicted flap endonuclease-1-like 5' DNA nuclease/outer membrane murein-binding lipoprotein Lpp
MPTVAELERLEALISRLEPLSSFQRGTLIRATDWNVVVGALIEMARAVLAEDRAGTFLDHDHPDQVDIGWLAPRLRVLIEGGGLTDAAAVNQVNTLERRLTGLATRLDNLNTDIKQVRNRVTDVATKDLARATEVTAVRRRIEGISDARDDVLRLRMSLKEIKQDLATAIDVGARLTVDGEPVDMESLTGRVKELEELRQRLTQPDGELLDAAALELRLVELINTFVSEEDLDEAFKSRLDSLIAEATQQIADQLGEEVQGQINNSLAQFEEENIVTLRQRLDALETSVETLNGQIAELIPQVADVGDQLQKRLPPVETAVQQLDERVTALEQGGGTSGGITRDEMDAAIKQAISQSVPGLVTTRMIWFLHEQLAAEPNDDFWRIRGIGMVYYSRLVAARVQRFGQIAQMVPDQLAEILRTSPEIVERWQMIEQAEELAAGGSG